MVELSWKELSTCLKNEQVRSSKVNEFQARRSKVSNVQFIKVDSERWELRVSNAVFGTVVLEQRLFGSSRYRVRTTLTVAGEGLRCFGGHFDSLGEAKNKLINLAFDLYDEMKAEFERACV